MHFEGCSLDGRHTDIVTRDGWVPLVHLGGVRVLACGASSQVPTFMICLVSRVDGWFPLVHEEGE